MDLIKYTNLHRYVIYSLLQSLVSLIYANISVVT